MVFGGSYLSMKRFLCRVVAPTPRGAPRLGGRRPAEDGGEAPVMLKRLVGFAKRPPSRRCASFRLPYNSSYRGSPHKVRIDRVAASLVAKRASRSTCASGWRLTIYVDVHGAGGLPSSVHAPKVQP